MFSLLCFSSPFSSVDEYIVSMERNLEVLMKEPDPLSEEEVAKFGQKNYEEYPPLLQTELCGVVCVCVCVLCVCACVCVCVCVRVCVHVSV